MIPSILCRGSYIQGTQRIYLTQKAALVIRCTYTPKKRCYSSRNVLATLSSRGSLQDVWPQGELSSHNLAALLQKEQVCVYAGFDPTAPSLHIGNLLVLMGLIRFQRGGHRPLALLGGATGRIGDPSGRSTERQSITEEELENNLLGIRRNIETIFTNHEKYFWPGDPAKLPTLEIVDNTEWYNNINIVDFLSTAGRRLRIGPMLGRKAVKARLQSEEGLSLAEFTYQAFQGYDWLHLHRSKGCRVQLGGSDQLGNMVAGQEMFTTEEPQCWGVTLPLIVDEANNKLGKSAGNPVWLQGEKTSPFDFYQFFIRQPDSMVGSLLRYFTFLPETEVEALLEKHNQRPEDRGAQAALAREVTLLVHGELGVSLAERTTKVLYSQDIDTLASLSLQEARQVFGGAPYSRMLFQPGLTVLEFALKLGCFRLEKDALRIIAQGGFYINTVRVTNIDEVLTHGKHVMGNDLTVVRVGKKHYYIVEWT